MIKTTLSIACWLFCFSIYGQISFTDQSNLLPNSDVHNGVALAVTDMNGDFLDDIIHLDNARNLMIELQQIDGTFITVDGGQMSSSQQWSLCTADVDENGYNDVISGGAYDGVHLALSNGDGTAYTISDLPDDNLFLQGSCFGDFNNDGSIDFYGCHDDGESRIWLNDGTGSFSLSGIINFDISATDDSGNYGVIWSDFDTDGDLDLYIAKCRQGVTDPTDARRINVLFENDGNNNFTENADAHGLRITAQSWTADFGDYDNDGDFDCFITNHDTGNMLLRNDNGVFSDVSVDAGIETSSFPLQGVFIDFDNDGFLDILLSGASHELYHNNGDGTFTMEEDFLGSDDMTSFALGDLNHDGFVDIYASYNQIYTTPSAINDKIWMNDGNDNNFIGVNLKGTVSNTNAIGAKIYAYGPWGVQLREVRAGQSYGIMNSTTQSFGLGTIDQVDSIYVYWPSGIIDIAYDPDPNQYITIIEDECVSLNTGITADGPLVFCDGGSVTLTADEGVSYLWSNNEAGQSITVTESGFYYVTVYESPTCFGTSSTVQVIVDPEENPIIEIVGETEFCNGGEVTLVASDAMSWEWSDNSTTQNIVVTESGEYFVTTQGICQEGTSESVTILVYDVEEPVTTGDSVIIEGTVDLESTGENPQWYDQEIGGNLVNTGNAYSPYLTETTSFWVSDINELGIDTINGGKLDNTGGGGENNPAFNGHLIFDAYEDFKLISVRVYAFSEAERTIEHRLGDGTVINSTTLLIPDGESVVTLNFDIEAGSFYEIGCDEDPSLFRNNTLVNYPYAIGEVGEISTSSQGQEFYYYFYDWVVEIPGEMCESDRVEVIGEVVPNSIDELELDLFNIYPNPTDGVINVEYKKPLTSELEVEVIDIVGKMIYKKVSQNQKETFQIDLGQQSKGVYFISLRTGDIETTKKIIKK